MKNGISAILLAAGESRRMGSVNKLTLQVGSTPLLRRTAEILLGASLVEIVVVLGHQSALIRPLLDGLPLRMVENPHFRDGPATSVQSGLQALREPCEGIMVCLSDQPLLDTADIDTLIRAFRCDCPRPVLVPTYQGRRGNPVVVDRRHLQSVLDGRLNSKIRPLIALDPNLVWQFPMDSDHCVFDLDTEKDYAELLSRVAGKA